MSDGRQQKFAQIFQGFGADLGLFEAFEPFSAGAVFDWSEKTKRSVLHSVWKPYRVSKFYAWGLEHLESQEKLNSVLNWLFFLSLFAGGIISEGVLHTLFNRFEFGDSEQRAVKKFFIS